MARYKKNYLNGSLFGNFNSNVDDKFNYLFSNIVDAHYDVLLGKDQGEFQAISLSDISTGQANGSMQYPNSARIIIRQVIKNGIPSESRHLAVKVRPTNIDGSIIPDPFQTSNQDERNFAIGMLEWAISDVPSEDINSVPAGSELTCFYADGRELGFNEKTLFFKASSIGSTFMSMIAQPFQLPISLSNLFSNMSNPAVTGDPTVCPKDQVEKNRLQEVANKIGIKLPVLLAIRRVESNGKPTAVRFEPHRFIKQRPDLKAKIPYAPKSSKNPVDYNYGNTNLNAFQRAYALDPSAAIYSTSWGLYQVMGSTAEKIDDRFLNQALKSKEGAAFFMESFNIDPVNVAEKLLVAWFSTRQNAISAAASLDWLAFAKIYNGPLCCGEGSHNYHIKLAQAYQSALKC
jgi:hypothetical protein